jgi:hypothetical protein
LIRVPGPMWMGGRCSAALVALAVVVAGCGGSERAADGAPITDVTCGDLRTKNSWRSVASDLANELTDQAPSGQTVTKYERALRTVCAGAADDFKPEREARKLRERQ